mmetsp:Transcript_23720/g.24179  ORF Transcript_23720/g.24179 Transcript_23720/m.24179 type:complete len:174 (-) Transcript_23720:705-1226(-)
MLDMWNHNISHKFSAAWISCLDKSMSKWVSQITCPGHMCVPRKPWPLGNEYHTIACGLSSILYALELAEGKDTPCQRRAKDFSELGLTTGLLLSLCQSIWRTSNVVILDSGSCVLCAIVKLRKKGVFLSSLIKKRIFWPSYIKGEDIKGHFATKQVGDVEAWPGKLNGIKFNV